MDFEEFAKLFPEEAKRIKRETNRITGFAMACDGGPGRLAGPCFLLLDQITEQVRLLQGSADGTKAHEELLEEAERRLNAFGEWALKNTSPHRCVRDV
jgi:hypothetical protein